MIDLVGERLGSFEIKSMLGVGGFATVYRAYDPRLKADVAIKILAENHSFNPDVRARFLNEAAALRRVNSSSVIDIHDISQTPSKQPYLVLEYADRGNLSQRRKEKIAQGWQPSLGDVRCLVETLGEALDAIHAEQMIHRDVTPANLLIRSGNRVTGTLGVNIVEPGEQILLADMGLAKDMSDGSGFTRGVGTAGFASPEQNEPLNKIDRRTDVYAASAVVLWLLTGEVASVQPQWPETLRTSGWPPALIEGLSHGLAPDPDARPSTMIEWRQLLMAALTTPVPRPLPSERRTESPTPSPKPRFVGRKLVGAVAGLVVAAVLISALALQSGLSPGEDSALGEIADNSVAASDLPLDGDAVSGDSASSASDSGAAIGGEADEQAAGDDTATSADASDVVSVSNSQAAVGEGTNGAPAAEVAGALVEGYDDQAPSVDRQRPGLYEPVVDPAYGTRVTRLNSSDPTRAVDTITHRQVENSDGSLLLTFHGRPNEFRVTRSVDGSLVRNLSLTTEAAPNWHPTDPTRIRYRVAFELKLHEIDVTSGSSEILADLTDRVQAEFPGADGFYSRDGGAPSADGARFAWYVFSGNTPLGALSYDLSTDTVLGAVAFDEFPSSGRPLGIDMSHTGDYVVMAQQDGTYVYNADLSNARLIFAAGDPGDLVLTADGKDGYAFINFDDGWLTSVDLATLTRTPIFSLFEAGNTLIELSGRGFEKPGWVVASTHDCKVEGAWTCDKVMAVELQPNGRVLNLAHTYGCETARWYRPYAVPNRDLSRVYFSSDNGVCEADTELMMIDVPSFN